MRRHDVTRHNGDGGQGPGLAQRVGRGVMLFVVGAMTALVCGLVVFNIALTLVPEGHGLRIWASCTKNKSHSAGCVGDDLAMGR